jgi:hypothetical protein
MSKRRQRCEPTAHTGMLLLHDGYSVLVVASLGLQLQLGGMPLLAAVILAVPQMSAPAAVPLCSTSFLSFVLLACT